MNIQEKLELYKEAKEAYYIGEPIMTDDEFDALEVELQAGSTLDEYVGYKGLKEKVKHPSRMLSLDKIKENDSSIPQEKLDSWLKSFRSDERFEITPKFDGCSVNLIYVDGKLKDALTRGNGEFGISILDKVKKLVPKNIDTIYKEVEIRGEALIKKSTFEAKYSEFKNPRNYIAGLLNKKDVEKESLEDMDIMCYDVKYLEDGNKKHDEFPKLFLMSQIFKSAKDLYVEFTSDLSTDFAGIFHRFQEYRKTSEYQLDGFVIKAFSQETKDRLGETEHHPRWALAVKFPPMVKQTVIKDIEWNLGRTGEIIPVGILEPTDLDGSVVTRVSLSNYGNVVDNKLYPEAIVAILKSGDIIPYIREVIKQSDIDYNIPTKCPVCDEELEISGCHLTCNNPDCEGTKYLKFARAVGILKLNFYGGSTIKKIYEGGIDNIVDLLNPEIYNKEFLMSIGFPDGSSVTRLLAEIKKIKSLNLEDVILTISPNQAGHTISKQIAKMYSGLEYSTYGLQNKLFEYFKKPEISDKVNSIIERLQKLGIEVVKPIEEVMNDFKTVELTGSPKESGYKTKEEFLKFAKDKGFINSKLTKDSTYLLTDSYNSSSSKMKAAAKLNVEIITYNDFIEKYK